MCVACRCLWRSPLSTRVSSGALSLPPALFLPLSDSAACHAFRSCASAKARNEGRSIVSGNLCIGWHAFSLWFIPLPVLYLWGVPLTWWWNVRTEGDNITDNKGMQWRPLFHVYSSDPRILWIVMQWSTVVLISSYFVIFNNLLCYWVYYTWFIGGHKWVTYIVVKELIYFL